MISWRQFHWSLIYPSLLKYIQYLNTHYMCDKFNKVDDQNVRNASNISVKNILQRLSAMASRVGFFNFESGSGIEEEKSGRLSGICIQYRRAPICKILWQKCRIWKFLWQKLYICKVQQQMSLFKYPIPENTRWFWKVIGYRLSGTRQALLSAKDPKIRIPWSSDSGWEYEKHRDKEVILWPRVLFTPKK